MGAELVTHRDGGAPVEVDGKHQRQFESCMAVDHVARLNNEDPQHPNRVSLHRLRHHLVDLRDMRGCRLTLHHPHLRRAT